MNKAIQEHQSDNEFMGRNTSLAYPAKISSLAGTGGHLTRAVPGPSPWQRVRAHLDQSYQTVFRHREWGVGVAQSPIKAFLEPAFQPRIEWLPPPRHGTFFADPFGVERDGRSFVLCEEFDYRRGRGVISAFEIARGRTPTQPEVVISESFHLSYPYLFEHDGDIFCVPETPTKREVAIYKALDFPSRWTRALTAIRGVAAADSTVFEHKGKWWLACSDNDEPPDERLLLWHAPTPLGPWEAHERNPVKIDRASARPAGTPFTLDGSLYRPAQDCSRTYGARVVINRVRTLEPAEFQEEPVAFVEPDASGPYPEGIHTLSAIGGLTLIDGFRTSFVAPAFPAAAKGEMQRTFDAIRAALLPRNPLEPPKK